MTARQSGGARLQSALLLTEEISYSDSEFEYRHVQLPKAMLKAIPKDYHDPSKGTLKLLWEDEWRAIGITQVGYYSAINYRSPQIS